MKKQRHQNTPASFLVLIKNNKVLLRRFNTKYEDGNYSMIAGHVDQGKTFTQCIIREAKEEADIKMNYLAASCPRLISPLAEADEVSSGRYLLY
ncbi:MAG: hypothetical protein COY69_00490, partial [Candidatus Magasanikbacteria bacterium CG_4_10_14_0_8_um_filter_32_14]|uniref:Nudix hydrolase domain-containing protein n=2 Tax=Candidatus Magasanikiibacteriota TaxID=1752731 RepID=A0A1J4U6X8_9BACT